MSACGSDAPPGTSTGTVADNGTPTTPARKPNILYIMADDLGYEYVAAEKALAA